LINKWVIQNKTLGGGKVRAQRYSMVTISHTEPGYTRSQMWSKRRGKSGRGRRLEDKKKEQISKNQYNKW